MRQIADGCARTHGVTIEVDFATEFIEAINAPEPTAAVVRAARAAGCETIPNRDPMSFSEDFAHFSATVPGCFLLLGNGETGSHAQPLHAADYDFNDALLPVGAALWSEIVRDRLPTKT